MLSLVSSDKYYCYCFRLQDKFSDYGIISAFFAERVVGGWRIDNWLMSCRAIGRGVENSVFDHFISTATSVGDAIYGSYEATEKNELVADLLTRMGFQESLEADGFAFSVGSSTNPIAEYIKTIDRS